METPNKQFFIDNPYKLTQYYLKSNYPDFLEHIVYTYPNLRLSEAVYRYYNGGPTSCPVCGQPNHYKNFSKGYTQCCSCVCSRLHTEHKRIETCVNKYGVANPMQSKEILQKSKQTCLERYGVEHALQSKEIFSKMKENNKLKYGVEYAGQIESGKEKSKQTCLERYGVEHFSQSEEWTKKAKSTWRKNLGVDYPMQSKSVRSKSKQTCLERYSVDNPAKTEEIIKKFTGTCLEKHGGVGAGSKIIQKKIQNTCIERYGCINPMSNIMVREKSIGTRKEIFLNSNPNIIGYTENGDWICKCPHPDCDKCENKQYITLPSIQYDRLRDKTEICTNLLPIKSQHSTMELWVCGILDSFHIQYILGDRQILSGKEIDIYIPELKIGIECNGCYWHSSGFKSPQYHINKTKLALEQDIRLYHVWEDWYLNKPEIIESMIKNWVGYTYNKIYARKCEIRTVSKQDCNIFQNQNHIQGKSSHSIAYGLYYKDELVSLMTFSKKRGCVGSTAGEEGWELVRFCSKLNTNVVGGAGKLFKHFLKVHNLDIVYSYASCDISIGNLYRKLGFTSDGKVSNSYWYIEPTTFNRLHRSGFTRSQISKKWPEYDINDKSWTESKVMKSKGYWKIHDAGMLKFVYRNVIK